jgi:hypothetical protein
MSFSQSRSSRRTDSSAGTVWPKNGREIALEGLKTHYAEDSEQDEEKTGKFDESRTKVHGEHDEESAIIYLGSGGKAAGVGRKDETEAATVVG